MQTKHCKSCDTVKSLEDFTRSKNTFKYSTSQSHHSYCKVCNAARAREWRKTHPNYKGTGRIKSIPKEDRLLMSAIRQRITDAKMRCSKLKKDPPILTDTYLYDLFLKQDRKCAILGVPLAIETENLLTLSLDQIEPDKGYVEGNVQWLSWCVNRAKGELSLDDFYELCSRALEYRKVQRLSNGSESLT